eukprot:TRINITY_DN874_c0_g3_i2.p1 TRINITY_DN874_c0_g3~~TRINITY_DN874_c0_g3_i2.p1  ORF type:complete len:309 (+),score=59.15 TRINITY_DN874_c0_g3_i2:78-1004(+)
MILLDFHNKIVEDTILEKYNNPEAIEAVISDFDSVTFRLSTDATNKNIMTVSISIKCFAQLRAYGVDDVLKKVYGANLVAAEANYDASVRFDLAQPPPDRQAFAHSVALLKRHCFSAPLIKAFNDIDAKKPGPLMEIRYRDEEAIYVKPEADRCTIVFSILFRDKDDVAFAKVFLQEYADARRSLQNVPAVQYSQKEPPLELKDVRNLRVGENNGFVTFVLFQPHMAAAKREKTIDCILTFRNYLHYHLKCSKAHIHARMRNSVRSFLQVLNRARSESESTVKKTMGGKTFKRADDPQTTSEELVGGV